MPQTGQYPMHVMDTQINNTNVSQLIIRLFVCIHYSCIKELNVRLWYFHQPLSYLQPSFEFIISKFSKSKLNLKQAKPKVLVFSVIQDQYNCKCYSHSATAVAATMKDHPHSSQSVYVHSKKTKNSCLQPLSDQDVGTRHRKKA